MHFVILTMAGVLLIFVAGTVVHNAIRFNPDKWLKQNSDIAEPYAMAILEGSSPDLPAALAEYKIEQGKDWVSFGTLNGPFNSHGMILSLNDSKPEHGLGSEPKIVKWKQIRDHWYYWVAD